MTGTVEIFLETIQDLKIMHDKFYSFLIDQTNKGN